MSVSRKSWRVLALMGGAVAVIGGCQENLAGGAACPMLCPDTLVVKDTVLTGRAAFDTIATVFGIPPLGTERQLLVANYVQGGLPVQTAAVMRFDSLVRIFPDTDTTHARRPITRVDSAMLSFSVIPPADTTKDTILVPDTVTFLIYDVNVNGPDIDTAAVHQRFSTAPIASRVVPRDSVKGLLTVPLDTGWVAEHVRNGQRIRLGIRIESPKPVQVQLGSSEGGAGATLQYVAYADTARAFINRGVNTTSTINGPMIGSLADYGLPLQATLPPPPGALAVGGIPGSRVYMHLNVPSALIDSSSTIVRANLILHQIENLQFQPSDTTDTLVLIPMAVQATPLITDVGILAQLIASPGSLGASGVPMLTLKPNIPAVDTIPLVGLFIVWKTQGPRSIQRAIVLQSSGEGVEPRRFYFNSLDAPADSLRPRLEISYIPKSGFGLP